MSAGPANPRRRWMGAAAAGAGLAALGGCGLLGGAPPASEPTPPEGESPGSGPPPAPREFRGAWVASVANIDWPSRPGLQGSAQREEMQRICERASAIGLNALILQVRPAADALYPSELEPWSEYLSGTQGRAPDPAWDPLQAWCDEAHARGLELHAWLNPYRARHSAARSPIHPRHVSQRLPQAVRRYGDQLWMDPGEPAAQAQTLAVVADLLRRYPVDGLHIDDYFYPYPLPQPGGEAGAELPFPDDAPYGRYRAAGGILGREDWRRGQVDVLVRRMFDTVRETAAGVRFGISPFGLMRPDLRPAGIAGFSQYDKLFADVERWLAEGWLDYLVPQLYWPRAQAAQAFVPLLQRWLGLNPQGRHVWPGLFTSRVGDAQRPWPAQEIAGQVLAAREQAAAMNRSATDSPGTPRALMPSHGHVHFSMVALMQDRDGIGSLLQREAYAQPALAPATPWVAAPPAPPAPRLRLESLGLAPRLQLLAAPGKTPPLRWAIWHRHDGRWQFSAAAGAQRHVTLDADPLGVPPDAVVVSAVDRFGQEGPRAWLRLG